MYCHERSVSLTFNHTRKPSSVPLGEGDEGRVPTLDAIRACRDAGAARPGPEHAGNRKRAQSGEKARRRGRSRCQRPLQQDSISSGRFLLGTKKRNFTLYLFSVHLDERAGRTDLARVLLPFFLLRSPGGARPGQETPSSVGDDGSRCLFSHFSLVVLSVSRS